MHYDASSIQARRIHNVFLDGFDIFNTSLSPIPEAVLGLSMLQSWNHY
jgi:hypothetical protein